MVVQVYVVETNEMSFRNKLLAGLMAPCLAALAAALPVSAQSQSTAAYPNKPVKMVVAFPPGGATDLTGRLLAGKLSEIWGQSVVVENKAGASGMIGSEQVMRSPADGYTVLVTITTHIQNPAIFAKMPYDPLKDFEPISQICLSYLALAVKPDFPSKDLKEFIALVKASPGKYPLGSFGTGTTSHILGERFARVAGLDMTHVPYKGSAPMTVDLLGGQIAAAWVDVSTGTALFAANKLRPLAVSGPARAPMLPNVPNLGEMGYAGFEPLGWVGVFVPAGTPKAVIDKLSSDIMRVVKMPDVQAKLNEQTLVPVGDSPESFAKTLRRDLALWAQIAAGAGIKPQ
jgi:tripartite-type tricarboxylate transporter receptor subunit TctC